ncbi:TIR domain-containing protein [Nocardia beijingensis]|uniref:nSTAND1 domain-containing NTPase n=1 Tax=Nocardia beijingensis TaxID=95162 RepID=UPI0033289151
MYRVFVSHSSRDKAAAVAVTRWLTENEPSLTGEIFLDVDPRTGIAPGTRWKSELVRAVDRCEAVICLISSDWERSAECLAEFRHAESLNKRIFCARIDPAARGQKTREWQFCDLFPDAHSPVTTITSEDGSTPTVLASDGLHRMLRGLREAGIGAEHFPWPPPGDCHRAPYRGWQSMEDVDAAIFFGRDPQILRGLDVLRGMRSTGVEGLFVVLGPSGVGKSSFLRAGLLPRLRRDRDNFLLCDIVRPERAAVTGDQGLANAILQLRSRAGLTGPALGDIKAACLAGDTGQLTNWLREARRDPLDPNAAPTLILPIDQAEELFTTEAGPEAATCLGLLGDLLHSDAIAESPIIAVVTIRADRYEALQTAPELLGVHTREFSDLKPMPVSEFKEVITGPAARATTAGLRLSLAPALVAQLVTDATGGADSLPLLALTLSRLYLDYGSTGELTLANYQSMGGMQHIVHAEIDTLLAADPDLRSQQLDVLHAAFIPWLATIDPNTDQPSRRVARWSELPPASHDLINAMVARRLLVKNERGGETVIEVALESLLRQWRPLARWLQEQAKDLKEADNLDRAAADWNRNARSPEWLIEGARLATAMQLANSPMFTDRVRHAAEFLEASKKREDAEAEAERQRRETELRNAQQRRDEAQAHAAVLHERTKVLRAVLALTLAVALVAVTGFALAVAARNDANTKRREADDRSREALAERLTSQAQAMLAGGQPGSELQAIAKLLAAQRISANPNIGALVTALSKKPELQKIVDPSAGGPGLPTLSADGQRIAAFTPSGIRLLDTETGQPIGKPFADPKTTSAMQPSSDGRFVAIFNADKTIRVWDSAVAQPIGQPLTGTVNYAGVVAVSPDGHRVAAADRGSADTADTLRLWDTETGQQLGGSLTGHVGPISALAFSPDGRHLASAGWDNTVRLWDASKGSALGEPLRGGGDPHMGDNDATLSVAFSPDGHTIAAGGHTVGIGTLLSAGSPLRLWNADTGEAIGTSVSGNYGEIQSVAFSPDSGRIATGSTDKTVRLWDAHTGQPIGHPLEFQASVTDVAFTRQGNRIVSVSSDTVQVSNADTDAAITTKMGGSVAATTEAEGGYGLDTTADRPRVLKFHDDAFRTFDADTGEPIGPAIVTEALRGIKEFDLSPDHRWLAVATGKEIHVVDTSNGQSHGEPIRGHDDYVNYVEFDPSGQTIATASDDKTVRLWDWRNGRQIGKPMTGHEYGVRSIAFSDDGHRLYSRSTDSIRIWDTAAGRAIGKPIGSPNAFGFGDMSISADGRRIAGASGKTIQQWDAESGEAVGPPMEGSDRQVDIAYSPDGRHLVSICADSTLRFWDTTTGRQVGEAVDTTAVGKADYVKFSHDGRRIFISAAQVSLDGNPPFVGGGIWQLPAPTAWVDALCDKLATNPSHEQWKDWISPDVPYRELCRGKPSP